MPIDPKVVHRAALDVLGKLQSPDLELPASVVPGVQVEAAEWIGRIEPLTTELGTLLRDIAEDRQEAGGVTVEKNKAIDEHDREVGLARRYLLALLRLADQAELAELVRRAIRRRARRSDVEALEEAAQPDAQAPADGPEASNGPPAGQGPPEGTPNPPADPAASG